jgi:beta-galactosidase
LNQLRLFNDGWEFVKQAIGTSIDDVNRASVQWQPVEIPHDWLIYNSLDLYETSEGWYRKTFRMDAEESSSRTLIRFEGVYMDSTVYVNGTAAGEWKYGYSTFEFDISDLLLPGVNEIMVRVVHQRPNSRWYSGAGIYRSVWLKHVPAAHLVSDGIYISPRREADGWVVEIETESIAVGPNIDPLSAVSYKLVHTILDAAGSIVTTSEQEITISSEISTNSQQLDVKSPLLWDLDDPVLYELKTELIADGSVIQIESQTFGFRSLHFDTNKGFFLNDRHVKIFGACQHHDLGSLGAAVNKTALRRQFTQLMAMGVNAIRTAHNMPAVELMELADELGILIVSEAFDMWELPKTKYDYARYFNTWAQKDVASWVRRDRNRPSLIMWSIGNEIYDTHAGERGQEITRMLQESVLAHDPKKNARVTIGSNYMPWENARKCADIVKLAGYNYAERYYDQHHLEYPDWIIYGSETSSTVQSRGVYRFPYAQSVLADDDEQCSSLGNCTTSWGAKNTEYCITADRDAEFSLGQFIWTGHDYIGEPTPYQTKNSYFGQLDTAGFAKDSFYIYQSAWTNVKQNPMVHIIPLYWDFNEGQLIDVRVASNAPKVELFFGEESQGTYDIDHVHGQQLLGHFQIPYRKGTLRAVAYDEYGAIVATDIRRSFGDASAIVLASDKTTLIADGRDLIFVEIAMTDGSGVPVGNANNRVNVQVTGAGRLVGLDNGDSTDYDSYKGTSRRLFNGKLLAIIAASLEAGPIQLEVTSTGMESQKLEFTALPCEKPDGISALAYNTPSQPSSEIPVRKIALVSPAGNQLSSDLRELRVHAQLFPLDATYTDVEWRVTNNAGIDSNIAAVKADGRDAIITAIGDGKFQLRCMSRNGSDKVRLISQLEFEITGVGEANLDPYTFITGGLYNASKGELGNGNERGVATARDGESHVGFRDVNFGEYGSDEITIPIFSLDGGEFSFEIWEGMPGEDGSCMLDEVMYRKGTIWNVYQEETYKLPRRIKGVATICFVLRRKIHIKGFVFKKLDKAYEQLWARENNRIYGDSFQIKEDAIEEIGNNVSLEFDGMDFGVQGCTKLVICGRSPIPNNTIHVRFNGELGEIKQLAEFTYSEDYVEREFTLDKVSGMQKVSFIFLPGCRFDFKWFQFRQ